MGLKYCLICGKLCRGKEVNHVELMHIVFGKFYKITMNILKNPYLVVCDDDRCKNTFSIWFMEEVITMSEKNSEVVEC